MSEEFFVLKYENNRPFVQVSKASQYKLQEYRFMCIAWVGGEEDAQLNSDMQI